MPEATRGQEYSHRFIHHHSRRYDNEHVKPTMLKPQAMHKFSHTILSPEYLLVYILALSATIRSAASPASLVFEQERQAQLGYPCIRRRKLD